MGTYLIVNLYMPKLVFEASLVLKVTFIFKGLSWAHSTVKAVESSMYSAYFGFAVAD